MAAGIYNFIIEAGATFRKTFYFTDSLGNPVDFTGCSFRAQLRPTPSSSLFYSFDCIFEDFIGTPKLPSDGVITLYMPATLTKTIICGDSILDMDSKYMWSLEKYIDVLGADDPETERILEGDSIYISPEVTKEFPPYV